MGWVIWMIVGRYVTIGFIFTPINAASLMRLPPGKVRMSARLINIMQRITSRCSNGSRSPHHSEGMTALHRYVNWCSMLGI